MSLPLPSILTGPDFADIDRYFAEFIGSFGEGDLPVLAAAFLSRNIRNGHICLNLAADPAPLNAGEFQWPDLRQWDAGLEQNRAIGGPQDGRPLVVDADHRCYLRRYWEYEELLAAGILKRCPLKDQRDPNDENGDMQEAAIQAALTQRFLVISGGPGTGKTTTVLKILKRLVGAPGGEKLRIALTAPTGKAAARLQETLGRNDGGPMAGDDSILSSLQPACTLHRLLGSRRGSIYFQHNAGNPLPFDVVVVDEASMVPLTMMAKLFDALSKNARVILLGDRDQLSSVEPGSVLGDIAEASNQIGSPLQGHVIQLERNYRFGNESGIFALCNAVRNGDSNRALLILSEAMEGKRSDLAAGPTPAVDELVARLRAPVLAGFSAYLEAVSSGKSDAPQEALRLFGGFRVLSALRVGPYGVENLNRVIESILRSAGRISGASHGPSWTGSSYPGMPVLITANDYALRLFNGDIGILMPDPDTGSLLAWFAGDDGKLRAIAPARLPTHEPAFAMTVHKSQGSEFGNVLFVLPDKPGAVLTRELVYTGLTRARHRVELWFQEPVLRAANANLIQRDSGLRARLSREL